MLIPNFALWNFTMYIYCCCLQKSKLICKIQNEPRDLLPDEK